MSGRFIRAATGMFAAVILFTGASATGAAEKQYTVTSSDGVTIAVEETGNPEGQWSCPLKTGQDQVSV